MIDKLIRRMIKTGYSDQDIVLRLRVKEELVKAIRKLMDAEHKRAQIVDEDWDE